MADGKIVATLKAGAGYEAPWLVFSGDTVQEVQAHLQAAQQANLTGDVALAASVFGEIYKQTDKQPDLTKFHQPQQAQPAQVPMAQPQYQEQAPPWADAPQQAPQPQYQPQQPAPMQGAPSCTHGQRVFKQGVAKSSGKPYKMWACPSQDRNNQCKAEFI